MSESAMGLFGHVPTPEEVHAKAFAIHRQAQPEGMWPGYVMGLADAGSVDDAQAQQLLFAALNGQFAHNVEPLFDDELAEWDDGDLQRENEELRDLVEELWEFVSKAERLQYPELLLRMRELGIEVAR